MYIYIYIYAHMHICIYIYIYTHTRLYIYIYIYASTHAQYYTHILHIAFLPRKRASLRRAGIREKCSSVFSRDHGMFS